ncbi:MAG TPA: RNA methyltransferase [Hyphomonadaceae bacterium]|nr:RNA methyltransferase [Hyphomonadaceae bacterium]
MTKDQPRNRPGNGPKSRSFPGGDARKAWQRERGADRARPEREDKREAGSSGDDKPWQRKRNGDKPGSGKASSGKAGSGKASSGKAGSGKASFSKPAGGKPWQRDQAEQRPTHQHSANPHSGDKPRRFDKPRGKHGANPDRDRPDRDRPDRARADRGEPNRAEEARAPDKARGEFRGKGDRFRDKHRGPRTGGPRHGGPKQGEHGKWERREAAFEEDGEVWIWGVHAAGAALANPNRKISKAYVSRNAAMRAGLDPEALPKFAELMEPRDIDMKLPPGAVHQGIAVRCAQIDGPDISDAAIRPDRPLVILDQVTDPQNVGAVYRSAAAFGLAGVVMQTRNAPLLGGALAKAAAGAIEQVDDIRAVNLSRAIDALTDAGWKVIGLDGSAEQTLDEAFAGPEPLAIVLGAEGAGIRPAVAKACTGLARIPIGADMESLNVSNAAAIAFYEAQRRHGAALPPAKPAVSQASENEDDEAADDGADDDADWDETD